MRTQNMTKNDKNKDSDFIFQVPKIDDSLASEYYTIIDKEDYLDENNNPRIKADSDPRICAKKIISNSKLKFLIKIDNSGKFYNPLSPVSSIKNLKLMSSISLEHKFKEVNYKTFDMYISFLRSKNQAWLNNAEREDF